LLVVTDTGSISYFDLKDARMEGRVLVPDQTSVGQKARISMDVDIDPDEPILTFNIGLDIRATSGSFSSFPGSQIFIGVISWHQESSPLPSSY